MQETLSALLLNETIGMFEAFRSAFHDRLKKQSFENSKGFYQPPKSSRSLRLSDGDSNPIRVRTVFSFGRRDPPP